MDSTQAANPDDDEEILREIRERGIDEEIRQEIRERKIEEAYERAASLLGERLRAAKAILRGVQLDIGAMAAEMIRLRDAGTPCPLDITQLANAVGISKPMVYKYVEMASTPEPRRTEDMDSSALAQLALQGYDDAEHELHRRHPGIWAWSRAADVIGEKPLEERTSVNDYRREEMAPAVKALRARYRENLKRMAAGPLPVVD